MSVLGNQRALLLVYQDPSGVRDVGGSGSCFLEGQKQQLVKMRGHPQDRAGIAPWVTRVKPLSMKIVQRNDERERQHKILTMGSGTPIFSTLEVVIPSVVSSATKDTGSRSPRGLSGNAVSKLIFWCLKESSVV